MSGRAIIIVVTGIIIISSVIFYNIEAASTRITANFNDYFLRQSAQNVAQSGVNLALRQLGNDRTWRAGFTDLTMLNGVATVTAKDTMYHGVSSVVITSTGTVEAGTTNETQATTVAYTYFPPATKPITVKGLVTLNASDSINGNIDLDAREHDLAGNVIAGQGTYAISTTGSTFSLNGSSRAGGTVAGIDYGLSNPAGPGVIQVNQPAPGGYPGTPDSAIGGPANGYPEGTLKAVAQLGVAGSQYVTDPAKLKYPLSGVTYVELPNAATWNPGNSLSGGGILIVHNANKNAVLSNMGGSFTGLLVADRMERLHGDVLGAIISLTTSPPGNVMGNGNARILYSTAAITGATSVLVNGTTPKVIGWWE
jgi:hypothetical protein